MNRRNFIRVIGLGAVATLASQLLAACGGSGGSSSSGGSGTSSDSDIWESYTVTGSASGVTKTYTVEIDYNHFHSAAALSITTFASATSNNSIQGTSTHPHYFDISSANVTTLSTVGGVITVTSTTNSDHPHNVRITRTV
jgi:hypothetical protein